MFYLGQFFGIIALIILIISFQKRSKDSLLKYQILSSLFFAIQYFFLNATSGWLMNLVAMFRNILFQKMNNKIPLIYLILVVILTMVVSIFSYTNLISLLPTIAVVLYSVGIWQKNMTITRIIDVISCGLFIIYNVHVLAIAGLISTILELISVVIAIYRFDFKMKE